MLAKDHCYAGRHVYVVIWRANTKENVGRCKRTSNMMASELWNTGEILRFSSAAGHSLEVQHLVKGYSILLFAHIKQNLEGVQGHARSHRFPCHCEASLESTSVGLNYYKNLNSL